MTLASLVLLHLLVRVDAAAAIKPAMVAGIAAEARSIWKPYGVDVTFAPPGDAVTGEPGQEIRLVITDHTLPAQGGGADVAGIGWIEFLGPEQPARTITVSLTAASRLSDRATWAGTPVELLPAVIREQFLVHALGRAAAHEIGHYLLRSTLHARLGLMRPQFGVEEIMDGHLTRFRLERSQVDLLGRRQAGVELQAGLP
jgi:hypothetical protein